MAISDRFDRDVAIVVPTKGTNAAGSVSLTDATAVASYECRIDPMTPKTRDLVVSMFGEQPTPDAEFMQGGYNANLAEGSSFLKDATNSKRYQVTGVAHQKGLAATPHHSFAVVREVPYA